MAMTWRDLGLPSRAQSWRALRGLRAAPPAAAATDSGRSMTFQTAIDRRIWNRKLTNRQRDRRG
jgi:hypothetical protein